MSPDEKVLKEMVQMRDGAFLTYLKARRAETLEWLAKADDTSYKKFQGRCDELESLIDEIQGSREQLDRVTKPRVPMRGVF